MQQEIVVYITGIHPTATKQSVYMFCRNYTGEISNVEVFKSADENRTQANVTVLSYVAAFNLIYAINYVKVDGNVLYANLCGYDVIRIQKEELFSIFISGSSFSSERELYTELSLFGKVFRVKLLKGCAVAQFYDEESMKNALSAGSIRGCRISKKASKKNAVPQKIEINDASSTMSKVSSKSRVSNNSNCSISYVPRNKVGICNIKIPRQSSSSAM